MKAEEWKEELERWCNNSDSGWWWDEKISNIIADLRATEQRAEKAEAERDRLLEWLSEARWLVDNAEAATYNEFGQLNDKWNMRRNTWLNRISN